MYIKALFLALIAVATSKDLKVGTEYGDKKFDEKKEAGPAIWVQDHNVTITANDTEVITGVTVTDLRPEKDGEAKIVEGGVGQKNVTIELKSPAVFRGYDFHVEVYAASEDEYVKNENNPRSVNGNQADENKKTNEVQATEPKRNGDSSTLIPPINLAKDIKVDKRETTKQSQSTVAPKVSTTTKDFKNPASVVKDSENPDYNEQPIVTLMMPTLKPAVNTQDSKLGQKDDSKHDGASTSISDDSRQEMKPVDNFTTLAKNINEDPLTTESVISSKTTPEPRNARDTTRSTTTTPKIYSAKDNVELKTNALTNTKVQDMTPYPMLKKENIMLM